MLFSQHGHLTLAHSDRSVNTMMERAEVNRLVGVDSRVVYPDEIKELCPQLDISDHPTFPILAALYHPPGGVIRHDAVVWGYGKEADGSASRSTSTRTSPASTSRTARSRASRPTAARSPATR